MNSSSLHRVFLASLASALLAACAPATGPAVQSPGPSSAQPAAPAQPDQNTTAASATTPGQPSADVGAQPPRDIVIGQRKTIRSATLDEDRTYWVYTPAGYQNGAARYPVMYLLDGDGHFHHTTGLLSYLAGLQRMPEMIVVAITNTDRTRDLTPTRVERFPTSGGADNFLAFIKNELIPEIESDYRTAPHRVLVGHSFGGLFAIHALNRSPETFHGYVSISPSLWWQDQAMKRDTEALLARRPDLDRFLYITLGNEREQMRTSNDAYVAMLRAKAPASLRWTFQLLEQEDHGSVPHRSTYLALEALYDEWRPKGKIETLAALQAHYARLSQTFGYRIDIPENFLNLFGYQLMGTGRMDDAIAAFKHNIELYPDSANVYDSIGEAYEKSGEYVLARDHYAIAVAKSAGTSGQFLDVYKQNLARASKLAAREKPAPGSK